jgi:predicted amidohydrolase YtcJ
MPTPPLAAETVYRDTEVVTGDASAPSASGLWVRGETIAGVGAADGLVAAASPDARIVSLGGATIVPGFIDAHCHLTMLAYLLTGADCSPAAAPTIEAILEALRAVGPGPEGWVTGGGYAEYLVAEGRHPSLAELDAAVPDLPCAVFHLSLHLVVVNTAGLRALGLDDASPDPVHSWLGRDGAGQLDGRLYEAIALDLLNANIRRRLEVLDAAGRAAFVRRAGDHLASLGITTTTDAAAEAGAFLALRQAEEAGQLPVRVGVMFRRPEADWLIRAGMTTGFGSDRLRIGAIKLFCDGGMSSRTAAVDEPYRTPPGGTGLLWYEPDDLAAVVAECDGAGFQVAVHAQGERGIRTALAAFEQVVGPGNPRRHRIEHGGCFAPELRRTAARLGIAVASQPAFLSALGDGYVDAFGEERADRLYPFASLLREGILVAGSSDAPVIGAAPLVGMRDARLRRTDGGRVLGADEVLTAEQALELYTRNAAVVTRAEATVGTLAPGKLADFVVLDRNPLTTAAEDLPDTAVRMTVVGGRVAHEQVVAA